MISIVVAANEHNMIGSDDALGMPWHLPTDLRRFRNLTLHKPVIMGRRTLSIIGRPLKNRTNIVLTLRQDNLEIPGVRPTHSWDRAVEYARLAHNGEEIMVIGGAMIYRIAMDAGVDRFYFTRVIGSTDGNISFPGPLPFIENPQSWRLIWCTSFKQLNGDSHQHSFQVYDRKR